MSASIAGPADKEDSYAGVPEERLFLTNARLQKRTSRSNTLMVAGSFAATLVAAAELIYGRVTPSALWVALLFYLIGMTGIAMGFHRLFSHRAFVAPAGLRVALAIAGSVTAQGSVTHWVSNHRRHHAFTDQVGDVHSPYRKGQSIFSAWQGFWHAQLNWIYTHRISNPLVFGKDMLRDRALQRVSQLYSLWLVLGILAPALIVFAFEGTLRGFLDGALWGGGVRIFFGIMLPSAVNSFGHMWGRRPYETADQSRNVAWLAWLTLGEGWHNNHHAFPASARAGIRWWQFDPVWWLILALERLRVVSDVRRPQAVHRGPLAREGKSG
ncbi:MAG: fatty acid desaturase [Ramlibacter sp.]|nr:fatty acid desaturase [Ramlibacter sp.]